MATVHALIEAHGDELATGALERAAESAHIPAGHGPIPTLVTEAKRFFVALERALVEIAAGNDSEGHLAALASDEAQTLATRGIRVASGLAILKCYRASLFALLERLKEGDDPVVVEPTCYERVGNTFDALEFALVDAWEAIYEEEKLLPLHRDLDRRTEDVSRYQRIISGLPLPVIALNAIQRIEHLNQAAIAFLQGATTHDDMHFDGDAPSDLPWIASEIDAFSASRAPYTVFEHTFPTATGERVYHVRLHRQTSSGGGEAGVVVVLREASSHRAGSEAFHRLAFYDDLTGLPNHALLLDRLGIEVSRALRSGRILIVAVLQTDGFEELVINEGHERVSQILAELSVRLRATVRRSDTLAIISGGTYGVLLPDAVHRHDMQVVATELLEAFDEPFVLDSGSLTLTASVGIALCPDDGTTPDQLLELATSASDAASETGGDGWVHVRQLSEGGE